MPGALRRAYRRFVKAIVQDRYGSPDILELRDIDRPSPADHEVLVRVHAAALNAYDWHFMRGDPYLARASMGFGGPKKKVRGNDFAGRVEAVGSKVRDLEPGDEVFGGVDGAFAEYVCVPENQLDRKPANLTFEQAAALPMAGRTALKGMREVGQAGPGKRVLINGASGGVGTFAVQIGRALDAEVTAVCSTRNVDLVRSLGADHVIDYTKQDFARGEQRYDVVFDLVGNRSLRDLRRVMTPDGTLVLSGGGVSEGGSVLGPLKLMMHSQLVSKFVRRQRIRILQVPPETPLAALRELAEDGKVTPMIERTYKLAEVPEAIRYVETEHARAKVVITVD